ncbi:MAG: hypothetical protein ABIP68_08545 [Ferruginibacter sp.]
MKKIFFLFIATIIVLPSIAQNEKKPLTKKQEKRQNLNRIIKQEEEGVITYIKHIAGGIKITTDGYGGFLELGRAKTVKKSMLFQFEVVETKHAKEFKQQVNFSSSQPIIYGKINFFYPIKFGVQQQILLGNKGNKNGVSITGNVGGGISLGLLRPYLINVLDNGTQKFIGYNDDSTAFLNTSNYLSGPGFGKGWSKLKVAPGVYIKPAVRFDYGKFNEMINALEVGATLEYYTKKVPQMVFSKQEQLFFSAYVSLIFGKRK